MGICLLFPTCVLPLAGTRWCCVAVHTLTTPGGLHCLIVVAACGGRGFFLPVVVSKAAPVLVSSLFQRHHRKQKRASETGMVSHCAKWCLCVGTAAGARS